jgi:hypothetical protein
MICVLSNFVATDEHKYFEIGKEMSICRAAVRPKIGSNLNEKQKG